MTNEMREQLFCSMYASYVNIIRKQGREPIPYRLYRSRMSIWSEW